jgi:AcrR family transcriptional regulator
VADRAPLTRDRIVAAAVDMADAEGLDALSMRKLAAVLGYEPMSLYNHIDNKDDLLAGMVDAVAAEMTAPDRGDWRASLHAVLSASRDALVAHPWAARLWSGVWPGPGRKRWMDTVLGCFRRAGFSVELTHHRFHAVELYVVGTVQQQLTFAMPEDPDEAITGFLAATPADDYPHLVEHVHYHRDHDTMADDDFELLLDLLLDGLERRASAEVGT